MITKLLRHRLNCLGWKVLDEGRQKNGRWWVLAINCDHIILARADTRRESWSAAWRMAVKLAREETSSLRLPRL